MSTQADQAGKGAAAGAAAAGAAGSVFESIPGVGTLAHGIVTAFGAIVGAIAGATKDTFHPTATQAAAWLWLFRMYPGLIFSGVDNAIAPERGVRLVRYFRLVSGEVPLPPGQNLYNPSNESCDTPYMCASDPREPLTDRATLDRIFSSKTKTGEYALPGPTGYVKTAAEAQAILALFRKSSDEFRDVLSWSEYPPNKGFVLRRLRALRKLAGESGPDADLAATFGWQAEDVDPGPTESAAKPAAKDARVAGAAGNVDAGSDSPAYQFGRAALVSALVFGGLGLLRHVNQKKRS